MKKKLLEKQLGRGLALVMAAMLIFTGTGCGSRGNDAIDDTLLEEDNVQDTEATNEDEKDASEEANAKSNDYADKLKEKYQESATDYSGEVIRINRDEPLKFELGYNPWALNQNPTEEFVVYQDAELKYPLELYGYDIDDETNVLTIDPPILGVAELAPSDDVSVDDLKGTGIYDDDIPAWGNLSQLYLATYVDEKTGDKLDKPKVTVIRINSEIEHAPRVTFGQTEDGQARFSWPKVEGADEYAVCSIQKWEDGFNVRLRAVARTKDTEWICDSYMDDTPVDDEYYAGALIMNRFFEQYYVTEDSAIDNEYVEDFETENASFNEYWDDYFAVIAIGNGGCSPVSNMIGAKALSHLLPNTAAHRTNDQTQSYTYTDAKELPAYYNITMCDGTTAQRVIMYDTDNYMEYEDHVRVTAKIDKTQFVGHYSVWGDDLGAIKNEIAEVQKRQEELLNKGGTVKADITFDENKDRKQDTKNEESSKKETEDSNLTENSNVTDDSSLENNTDTDETALVDDDSADDLLDDNLGDDDTALVEDDKLTDKPDESLTEEPETLPEENEVSPETNVEPADTKPATSGERKITANSALSEYIASQMLQTKKEINIGAFSEAANMEVVADAFGEAQYQNPLILGVRGADVDTMNQILYVEYDYDASETASKQKAIESKVSQIVSEIIKPGMSDEEKELAINEYLCDHAEYDHDALDNAQENDFKYVDPKFNDSFTAYGILVDGLGVCAGYAGAFKLLADAAGLDSIVVTGYLDGSLAHAWNKVKIGDEWNIIDVTNNDNDQVPNALYNLSDDAAWSALSEDGRFALDDKVYDYAAKSDSKEYYRARGKFFDVNDIADQFSKEFTSASDVMLRTDYNIDDDTFSSIAQSVVNKTGKGLRGYYWMGVIHLSEQ